MKHFTLICCVFAVASFATGERNGVHQTIAPHELRASVAPAPIIWDTPELPGGRVRFESAEERRLELSVVAKHLEQPWSIAFLPDGSLLVTERPGRIRLIRNGKLVKEPVRGAPVVQTGGEGNLQD
jgi:glucose/arabinose dehydrogenase